MAEKNDLTNTISELAEELMGKIGVEADVDVDKSREQDEDVYHVSVSSEKEAGLLIGTHGATLQAIQSFLAMALRQETGEWVRVLVDIGDWRQKHEDHLVNLANQAAERAMTTGESQHLYNLTASQRRIVHMALSKIDGVETESEGEGESRYLVVKPL